MHPAALRVARLSTRFRRLNSSVATPTAASAPKTRKRTKKNYEELPTTFIREDGTPAAALEPIVDYHVAPKVRRKRPSKASTKAERETLDGSAASSTPQLIPSFAPIATDEPLLTKPASVLAIQIQENRRQFPESILLTRVGQFYESYFEQAPEVAQLLNIKLTSRPWGGGGRRVHMCGFPLMHLDRHLKTLVQSANRFVALCEEFPPAAPGQEFVRRVVRVVTPGTLIDESFVNAYENNYLLSITRLEGTDASEAPRFGLAWIDVSTGEFYSQNTSTESLRDDIARIAPREVVLFKDPTSRQAHQDITRALSDETNVTTTLISHDELSTTLHPTSSTLEAPSDAIDDPQDISAPLTYTPEEIQAIDLLNKVLKTRLLEHMPSLPSPLRQNVSARMQIDSHTIHALEIKEAMREGGTKGSLLSTIKRTTTNSGTRLLSRWLCSPSTSLDEIHARQAVVAALHSRIDLRADLIVLLKESQDVSRIVQRFMTLKGDAEDLMSIRDAITVWTRIQERIMQEAQQTPSSSNPPANEDWKVLETLVGRLKGMRALAQRIDDAIDEDALRRLRVVNTVSDPFGAIKPRGEVDEPDEQGKADRDKRQPVFVIRPQFSQQLAQHHDLLEKSAKERSTLEVALQQRFNAPSLTLRHSAQHGFHVHVGKIKRDDAVISQSGEVISLAKTKSTHVYLHKDWLSLGKRIVAIEGNIQREERISFEVLRSEVLAQSIQLRANARVIDELDVALGFASLAAEMGFTRPTLNQRTDYCVVNGRHPTVELGLLSAGRNFIPNTVIMDQSRRLHLITGPNMSGKSSLLRQTALISILAQVGSFVPADDAELGLVDKVFSRIGAKDDLFRDRSTFMVEMLETAEILRRATPRSLVIMDEVGRGTTMKDGMAIAFATLHHLYGVNQSRALFATHFHELADMLGYDEGSRASLTYPGVGFFCTNVDELEDGSFTYSHHLEPGVNRNSHGLKVAHIAGMPPSVLDVASKALEWMHDRGGEFVADRDALHKLGAQLSVQT
ncbi:hypothetical protein DL93DRAFT_2162590 [Clavulina sp. PMI_390]|nr:hypothetical protein DL93DRAFT_2162590 [Clavulina sp. PMI_390]